MESTITKITTEALSLENSFGVIKQDTVELECTVFFHKNGLTAGFEVYDRETGGDEWHAEGGLWFEADTEKEQMRLYDYDGVFALPSGVLEILRAEGINVEECE
jgi:hypothetical protein